MDRSGKQVSHVHVNLLQKKRKGAPDESSNICFYCGKSGHFKPECVIMQADRDPNRPGGPIYRTDTKTAPGAYKAKVARLKRAKTVNVVKMKEPTQAPESSPTINEELSGYSDEELLREFPDGPDVPMSDAGSIDIDRMEHEVSQKYKAYLLSLKGLKVTDTLWIVDTGAGHGITPNRAWFKNLTGTCTQTFVYGNNSTSKSRKKE
jgi:hypothetical protein